MSLVSNRKSSQVKFWATGLFFASMILFIVSKVFENSHPIWPWLQALSEASMVGALADWFAVTALFRHPLGIPIPHTAIIPNSQERISQALSRFVQENFLDPESLAPKLSSAKLAVRLTDLLVTPAIAKTVARQLKDFMTSALGSFNDQEISNFIAKTISAIAKEIKLAPLLAEFLSSLGESDKDGKFFDELLKLGEKLLTRHNQIVGGLIHKELPWYVPAVVRDYLYKQVFDGIANTIIEMRADKNHILRKQLWHLFNQAVVELRNSEEWELRLQTLLEEAAQKQSLLDYLANVQFSLLTKTQQDSSGLIIENFANIIIVLANAVSENKLILDKLDQALQQIALRAVRDYGTKASSFIEETMSSWDSKVLSEKIESEVGRDLQFIRINGTIVGGLVGLILHATLVLIENLS